MNEELFVDQQTDKWEKQIQVNETLLKTIAVIVSSMDKTVDEIVKLHNRVVGLERKVSNAKS